VAGIPHFGSSIGDAAAVEEGIMKLDTRLATDRLDEVGPYARWAESMGFDMLWSVETAHDPFLPLAVAALSTTRIGLGTAIALAFTRSPTVLAYTSWDLQEVSVGRFRLGLGTQVKGHNERRFGVPYVAPVKKLGEVVQAMRAVFGCWQNGTPLRFEGEFFNLSLMTPVFTPRPLEGSLPPIYIAGVNRRMVELAGRMADGFLVHPLHTSGYLTEALIPWLEAGATEAGRSRSDVDLSTQAFVAAGDSEAEIRERVTEVKRHISFYASTRTYAPVLQHHGWQDLTSILWKKAAAGVWESMARDITDEMLGELCVVGPWDEIPARLKAKYRGLLDRLSFYDPPRPGVNDARLRRVIEEVQS